MIVACLWVLLMEHVLLQDGCPQPKVSQVAHSMNRTIWMFWDDGANLSNSFSGAAFKLKREKDAKIRRMSLRGWRRLNPTWRIRLLNVASASALAPRYATVVQQRNICIPLQADLLRAELLSKYGGVWADVTTVPVHPLDQWLPALLSPGGFWAFSDADGGTIIEKSTRFKHEPFACLSLAPSKMQAKNCQPSWLYENYHDVQGALNWFLAVDRPHHPLIDAWLEEYTRNLQQATNDRRGPPYFLQACSLTAISNQAQVQRALHAMPAPCGVTSVVNVRDGRRHHAVSRKLLMYKRPNFSEDVYTLWLAHMKEERQANSK